MLPGCRSHHGAHALHRQDRHPKNAEALKACEPDLDKHEQRGKDEGPTKSRRSKVLRFCVVGALQYPLQALWAKGNASTENVKMGEPEIG